MRKRLPAVPGALVEDAALRVVLTVEYLHRRRVLDRVVLRPCRLDLDDLVEGRDGQAWRLVIQHCGYILAHPPELAVVGHDLTRGQRLAHVGVP